jgi:hypothetical protein
LRISARRSTPSESGNSGGKHTLFNAKLNGSIDNQLLANATQLRSNCHIEEKRREEKSKETTNARRKNGDERTDAEQAKAQRLKSSGDGRKVPCCLPSQSREARLAPRIYQAHIEARSGYMGVESKGKPVKETPIIIGRG